jgi:hypothetical protein
LTHVHRTPHFLFCGALFGFIVLACANGQEDARSLFACPDGDLMQARELVRLGFRRRLIAMQPTDVAANDDSPAREPTNETRTEVGNGMTELMGAALRV